MEITLRYILSLLYAACNCLVIPRMIDSYRKECYGWFGFFTSLTILNVFMMIRMMFFEI